VEIAGLSAIDWTAPWLLPFANVGADVAAQSHWLEALNRAAGRRAITTGAGRPLLFELPVTAAGEPYEAKIARSGRVPTRANLHDFFSALAWLSFPRSKARLNALQADAIAREGVGETRGALRDAATLIDENAVLLVTRRADLVAALRSHDWPRLFLAEREAWDREVRALGFGHALIEKLARPYKAITAHALPVDLPASASVAEVDAALAAQLDDRLSARQLLPVPVLGIPGWCAENADPAFYADAAVFRPAKVRGC
jgi:hypothetical protein